MRIVSLEPFLTELVCHFELAEQLVGVSHHQIRVEESLSAAVVTSEGASVEGGVSSAAVSLSALRDLTPDLILTALPGEGGGAPEAARKSEELSEALGQAVVVKSYSPRTLEQVYDCYRALASDLGVGEKGRRLADITKAEFSNWIDNFYARTKGKKVCVLVDVAPLTYGGLWFPDLIRAVSGRGPGVSAGSEHQPVDWQQIREFDPDVIVVAPNLPHDEALGSFQEIEKLPGWDDVRAVKRGDVFFVSGQQYLLRPSQHLRQGLGIFISAVAGFESGYITERDSFQRLRWLELQRHRFQ